MAPHDHGSAVQDTPKTTRVTKRLAASKANAALHKTAQLNHRTMVLTPPDSPNKLTAATPKPRKKAAPKAKNGSLSKSDATAAPDSPTKERKKPGRKPRVKTEGAATKRGGKPVRSGILRKTGRGASKKKVAFSEEDVSIEIEQSPSGTRSFCSIM
ncbi:hypothetical protein HDU81_002680 [Chytriomyces hyalinus]|nr:hypothetical protein HDU81_002680 [Chytriomyces hyalinus]